MNDTVLRSTSLSSPPRISKSVWVGRIISGIAVVLMALEVIMKLARVKEAIEGTAQLGFSPSIVFPLGLIQLASLLLYVFPRTAPLGATLWTAYLGGAVAINVRMGNPMFTHILAPVYFAILIWGGLYLRDARVRAALGPIR